MSFTDLGIGAPMLDTLIAAGYAEPTAVQRAAIPAVLSGSDLLVSSHTGSGNTAAVMLPCLRRMAGAPSAAGLGPLERARLRGAEEMR